MTQRYTHEEVKQKFIRYRDLERSQLTEDEYGFFCGALHMLSREILDNLDRNADFVMLSAQPPTKPKSACIYFPPEYENARSTKPVIILTPIIFGFGIEWDKRFNSARKDILHEVAHFHLRHRLYEGQEDMDRKEKDANALAQKWIDEYHNDPSVDPEEGL